MPETKNMINCFQHLLATSTCATTERDTLRVQRAAGAGPHGCGRALLRRHGRGAAQLEPGLTALALLSEPFRAFQSLSALETVLKLKCDERLSSFAFNVNPRPCATGGYLPLLCTMNCTQVVAEVAAMLGGKARRHSTLSQLNFLSSKESGYNVPVPVMYL